MVTIFEKGHSLYVFVEFTTSFSNFSRLQMNTEMEKIVKITAE